MCGSHGKRAEEWELCVDAPDGQLEPNRRLLKNEDPDGFGLITDPFYKVPLKMPDGSY